MFQAIFNPPHSLNSNIEGFISVSVPDSDENRLRFWPLWGFGTDFQVFGTLKKGLIQSGWEASDVLSKNPAASFSWYPWSYCWAWMTIHLQFTGFWLNGDVCPSAMAQNTRKLFLTVKKLHIVDIDICWSGGTPHPISHSFFVPIPANGGMFSGMILCWLIFMLKGGKSLKVIGIWELAFDNVHLVYIYIYL